MRAFFISLTLFASLILSVIAPGSFAQAPAANWLFNPYDEPVFIENKGQYVATEKELHCTILYCMEQGNTTFFICSDRYIVRESDGTSSLTEEQREQDPAQHPFPAPSFHYSQFFFDGANAEHQITTEQKSSSVNRFSFRDEAGTTKTVEVNAYSGVVIHSLYEGIDLSYSCHAKNGIVLQFTISPAADISKINIRYSGEGTMSLDEGGTVNVRDASGKISNRVSHVSNPDERTSGAVFSSFDVHNNTCRLIAGTTERTVPVNIALWVVDPAFTDQNVAFDIAADTAGNVFVFGGHAPWKLKKFSPAGSLSWTYNSPFSSWYGALAVDQRGSAIITDGCCSGAIYRLDSAGGIRWNVAYGVDEFWRLAYNCDFSKLYIAAGYSNLSFGLQYCSISLLDTVGGGLSNSTEVFAGHTSEPRSLNYGLNANLYTMSCTGVGGNSNEVLGMTPAFTTMFSVADGYGLLYNGPLYANGTNSTAGQNGIAAGKNFLCTSDGATLYKRQLNNGALIASIPIPGGSVENNSGVFIDFCDSIYVGTSNAILKYDAALNLVGSVATTGPVYCIAQGYHGQLLACGAGFITSVNMSVCATPAGACNTVLPVTLTNFSLRCLSAGVEAGWETQSETNNDYFTLQRSADGITFETVQKIKGAGNSSSPLHYNFTDTEPINGTAYYRLQQTDFDGTIETFGIKSINSDCGKNNFSVTVLPNPAKDQFTIHDSQFTIIRSIEIFNTIGEKVYSSAPDRKQETINTQLFPAGLYYIKMAADDKLYVQKLVIQ